MKPKEIINEFEEKNKTSEIILLGKNGAIRRIILDDDEELDIDGTWNY